jgi:hypothetical protein
MEAQFELTIALFRLGVCATVILKNALSRYEYQPPGGSKRQHVVAADEGALGGFQIEPLK